MAGADHVALPDDVASLQAMVVAMREQIEQERSTHEQKLATERANGRSLREHIEVLKQQLATLRRGRFGRSSEKFEGNIRQLELIIEDLEASAGELPEAAHPEPKRTHKPVRRPLPPALPRETVDHGVRDDCEHCGGAVHRIGEDVSEVLEYVPASFRVIRHVRPKYSCRCCEKITQAPAPDRPVARGMAGPGLLAHVAVAKFADHCVPRARASTGCGNRA